MPKKKSPTQTSLNHSLAGMSALISPITPHNDAERAEALLRLAIGLVDSAIDILEKHITRNEQLQHDSVLMPGGTVGKHFRHVIETYRAFLLPLQPHNPSPPPGIFSINYDAILPSTRAPVARSLHSCRKAMRGIRNDLEAWGNRCHAATPYQDAVLGTGVVGEVREGVAEEMSRDAILTAITPTRQELGTTIGRELWFCSLHAIHHFSMLRTIAVHELGLELPVEFGTAPSTLLYRGKDWSYPAEKKEVRVMKSKL